MEFGISEQTNKLLFQVNRRCRTHINTRHNIPLLESTIRLITRYSAFSANGLVFQQAEH